jgi:hypothetical protein
MNDEWNREFIVSVGCQHVSLWNCHSQPADLFQLGWSRAIIFRILYILYTKRSVEPHKHSIACSSRILLNSKESGWTSKEPRLEYHEGTRSSRLPSWCNMLHQFPDIESDSERWKGQIWAYCSILQHMSMSICKPAACSQKNPHNISSHFQGSWNGMTTTGNCRIAGKKQYDLVVCFV